MTDIPLAASKTGNNAYYCEFCPHTGNRPSYAACLNRIDAVNLNEAGNVDNVCVVAIQRGHCEALEMRENELIAGKAIYYIDRVEMRKETQARLAKQGISFGAKNKSALTFKKPSKVKVEPIVEQRKELGNYSITDAINKKLKESSSVPQNSVVNSDNENKVSANLYFNDKSETLSNIKSGMSLAEIANSIKASNL